MVSARGSARVLAFVGLTTAASHRSITISIPSNTTLQYKYLSSVNGTATFEADPNRFLSVPQNCVPLVTHDTYQQLAGSNNGGGAQVAITTTTTSSATSSPTSCPVLFEVLKTTVYNESVLIAGSIPQLSSWTPSNAQVLSAAKYTTNNPEWYVMGRKTQ